MKDETIAVVLNLVKDLFDKHIDDMIKASKYHGFLKELAEKLEFVNVPSTEFNHMTSLEPDVLRDSLAQLIKHSPGSGPIDLKIPEYGLTLIKTKDASDMFKFGMIVGIVKAAKNLQE